MLSTELNALYQNTSPISALLSDQDRSLVAGCYDGTIQKLSNGSSPLKLQGHTKVITSLAVFRDNWLISASLDNTIRIWDTDGSCKKTIMMPSTIERLTASKEHIWFAATLTTHPNATFSFIYIWNGNGPGKQLHLLAKRYSPLAAYGNKLIFVDINNNIVIYDLQIEDITHTIKLQGFNPLNYISCQPRTENLFTNICVYNNYLVYGINSRSKTSTMAGQIEDKTCSIYFVDLNTNKQVKSYKLNSYHLESLIAHNLGSTGILQDKHNKKFYQNFNELNCSCPNELPAIYKYSLDPVPFGSDGIAFVSHNAANTSNIYTLRIYQQIPSNNKPKLIQSNSTDDLFAV